MRDHTVENVDLLVIGGGKAGKSLEMDLAKAGWKVAMVERDKIGGTCINVACITTKALVGSARTMLMARNADVMGVELGEEPLVSVDGLRQHKSSVVDGWRPPTKRCSRIRAWISSWGLLASSRLLRLKSRPTTEVSGSSEEPRL
jgi:pyruvate/2-oxoglutarate dehydrogenase complex dihydrolipoamide dehydrogenase (E3) component